MKQITCSEFRKNMPKYLKELPLELLNYNEVVAVVQLPNVVQENKKNVVQTKVIEENVVQETDIERDARLHRQFANKYLPKKKDFGLDLDALYKTAHTQTTGPIMEEDEVIEPKCVKCHQPASDIKSCWEDGNEYQACGVCRGVRKRT